MKYFHMKLLKDFLFSYMLQGSQNCENIQHFTFDGLGVWPLTTERGELSAQSSVSWCVLPLKNK